MNADMHLPVQDGETFAAYVEQVLVPELGAELIAVEADQIDPVAMHRLGPGRIVADGDIGSLTVFLDRLVADVQERMRDLAGLVYPTTPVTAPLVEDVLTPATAVSFTSQVLSLTRVANAYGLTACSIPLPQMQGKLPIGIDVAASAGGDRQCLGLACVIEAALAR